jgi:hypothetical protein
VEVFLNKRILAIAVFALLVLSTAVTAQAPKGATYITDAQAKAVNALPGVDRQIVSVDIGKLNEAVGVIHRGPTNAAPAGRGAALPRFHQIKPAASKPARFPRVRLLEAFSTTIRPRPTSSSPAAARLLLAVTS